MTAQPRLAQPVDTAQIRKDIERGAKFTPVRTEDLVRLVNQYDSLMGRRKSEEQALAKRRLDALHARVTRQRRS